jgi:hypothetical protein
MGRDDEAPEAVLLRNMNPISWRERSIMVACRQAVARQPYRWAMAM